MRQFDVPAGAASRRWGWADEPSRPGCGDFPYFPVRSGQQAHRAAAGCGQLEPPRLGHAQSARVAHHHRHGGAAQGCVDRPHALVRARRVHEDRAGQQIALDQHARVRPATPTDPEHPSRTGPEHTPDQVDQHAQGWRPPLAIPGVVLEPLVDRSPGQGGAESRWKGGRGAGHRPVRALLDPLDRLAEAMQTIADRFGLVPGAGLWRGLQSHCVRVIAKHNPIKRSVVGF